MATTISQTRQERGLSVTTITATAQNDTQVFEVIRSSQATIQLSGSIGAANALVECSNDGITYASVPTPIVFTAIGIKAFPADALGYRFYRVVVNTGAPGGTLTFTIVAMEQR